MYIIILFTDQVFKSMMKHFFTRDTKARSKIIFRIEYKRMTASLGGKKEIKQR